MNRQMSSVLDNRAHRVKHCSQDSLSIVKITKSCGLRSKYLSDILLRCPAFFSLAFTSDLSHKE